jgi:GTP cyclohydrolase IA
MRSVDIKLGLKVNEYLIEKGVETPSVKSDLTPQEKKDKIAECVKTIMETLSLDLTDDSLIGTPKRVAKMYVDEVFWGLDYHQFPKCTTVQNKMKYDEMVLVRDINVQSNCEHHLVVIDGLCDIAYIPKDKVLGLSKLNRIVEFFAKRPQIQERLTEQIYYALNFILETEDIAVKIKATHYCVKSRGIQDTTSYTITSKIGGVFKTEPEARNEFLTLTK